MRLALAALVLLACVPAQAGASVVTPADPVEYADRAAIGFVTERGVRTPIALLGAGGLLTSESTRIDGLVTAADVAAGRLRVVPNDDPAEALERLDDRIERNDRWRLPLTIALATLLIGLAFLRPRWALRALLVALAANLWLSPVLALVAGVAVLALPLGLACGAILAAYLVSMGLDAETVALSPFGPSQSGRFYGINNLLETMLLAPALVGAALLGRAGIVVAALAFVTIGGNRFGADGGGIVVLAAAYLVLLIRLQGRRPTWRLAAVVVAGAIALALGLLGLDAATGGSSHVTDAVGDGPVALAGDVADRIEHSVRRTAASAGATAVVLGSLAILVAVALRARREPVLDAFLVGLAVSLVVNDTPADVLGIGAAIAVALARHPPWHVPLSSSSMRRAATLLVLLALSVGAAGCGGGEETTPLPETVEGTVPAATTSEAPTPSLEGDASAGEGIYASAGCGGCHTLDAAGSSGTHRPESRRLQARLRARRRPRHEWPGRDAVVRRPADRAGNRRRRPVRRRVDVRLILPADFPRDVAAIACDLDRTLIAEDGELRPRTIAAIGAARGAGIHVLIATGRMFRSVLPYARAAGIEEPLVCYQGAAVVEPATGEFLLHEPIPLELAREAIAAVQAEGFGLNCYVDDELYVAEITPNARDYADFQHIPITEVGDLLAWLERPPTKLVIVATPEELDALRPVLVARFGDRLFIAKSLPHFLELASPSISKGSGLAFVAEQLGFTAAETVAFGDGENDRELLEWAGYGVCVENGADVLKELADWICPGPEDEGVAQAIEAFLDSRA